MTIVFLSFDHTWYYYLLPRERNVIANVGACLKVTRMAHNLATGLEYKGRVKFVTHLGPISMVLPSITARF